MRGPIVVLAFAGFALAWMVLFGAGVRPEDRNAALLFFGAVSFFYWPFRGGQTAPPLKTWHGVALIALPCYLLFQLIPFPPSLLQILSPARAALTDSLAATVSGIDRAPISVTPAASLFAFFGFLGYIAMFLLVRDVSWRFTETRNWIAALPLIVVALVEALIGCFQGFPNIGGLSVRGSYPDRDHFCAFLEMVLPLSLVCGYDAFRHHRANDGESSWPAIAACVMWGISTLLFILILHSGSRASPLVLSASLLATGLLVAFPYLKTKQVRWVALGALLAGLIIFLIINPPDQFVERLSDLAAVDKSPEEQLALWKETIPVLSEFRWFGTGLGGFESSFLKYQGTIAALRIASAHNDYLNYLVELGFCGVSIFAVAVFGVIRPAVRGCLFLEDEHRRLLSAAGIGCLVAIALRGMVDSNLLVPANAFAFAWIAGLLSANGLE